ncbi:hypothetical protein FQZ97_754130 [compost metagenome]
MNLSSLRSVLAGLLPLLLVGAAVLMVQDMQESEYRKGHAKAADEGALALEQLRGEHHQQELLRAQAAEADAKANAKRLQEEQQRADGLAAQLAEQQRTYRKTTDQLVGEIARVNDLYRKALDAEPEPLPACVFTRGFVRVWNQATGAVPAVAAGASGAATQGADAGALDQLDAGIGRAQLLEHHIRYAEQCRNTSAQLNTLIDVVQGNR